MNPLALLNLPRDTETTEQLLARIHLLDLQLQAQAAGDLFLQMAPRRQRDELRRQVDGRVRLAVHCAR